MRFLFVFCFSKYIFEKKRGKFAVHNLYITRYLHGLSIFYYLINVHSEKQSVCEASRGLLFPKDSDTLSGMRSRPDRWQCLHLNAQVHSNVIIIGSHRYFLWLLHATQEPEVSEPRYHHPTDLHYRDFMNATSPFRYPEALEVRSKLNFMYRIGFLAER
jgi:hypothetical protein